MTVNKTDRERTEKLSVFSKDLTNKTRSLIDVLGPYAPLARILTDNPNAKIVTVQVTLRGCGNSLYCLTFTGSGKVEEIHEEEYVTNNDVMKYIALRFNKVIFGTLNIMESASISVDGVIIDPTHEGLNTQFDGDRVLRYV